ncbi:MAG TPA: CPBP family intramembrane glutamic endopeptidase, partial [Thermoanaerobaculia bacterium]|nr:CPBP family intramembrane glutamic endopeptidase [Thermoanaerobaculia bacterium]
MPYKQRATGNQQRLTQDDWIFIAVCVALALTAVGIVIRYFPAAFPQASIDFQYDRDGSRPLAQRLVQRLAVDTKPMKHAARFDGDDSARIFLERSLGLEEATRAMTGDVHVWYWTHRWFRPLVEEEISVSIAPTGEVVAFTHKIPEERAIPGTLAAPPEAFLISIGVDVTRLRLVDTSERRLPHRIQRIYTWESIALRPAGAAYRHTVIADGTVISSYSQQLKVPDAWLRSYRELRSKNAAAGSVDLIFNAMLMIGAIVVFIVRLRRGDLPLRFLIGIGVAGLLLVGGMAVNQLPSQLAYYDTTTSYPAFLGQLGFQAVLQSIGTAMLLIVICGAGEVLYRERLPRQLAIPRLWTPRALASRRVFLAMILGYALVPLFIAYQVVFYLTAHRFGAWSPAEVPYDDLLNTALPWVAVMFAGFFPAFSEEFLSRAFAIPFLQKLLRSRWTAIILAAFIWGFGHSTYPNQPFWIRGVEVGLVGIVAGLLMERYGLLPLLIWHYTIDAVYTATLLFASGNTYYIVSAALASLLFAIPLVASVVLYVRNKGFVPDDELSNFTIPSAPPDTVSPALTPPMELVELAPSAPLTRRRVAICVALVIAAAIAIAFRPPSPSDALDYRITKTRAKEIARQAVPDANFAYVIAAPVEGFRSWNPNSSREDGGAAGGFDDVAATWLARNGMSVPALIDVFRNRIEAGTWTVRFFTPLRKEELYVEVDPRTSRVIGYHKYQAEEAAGRSLAQEEALTLARAAFATYVVDVRAFDLKEALSFQQPARRDWLFHFDERTPLAPRAFRRVTVRVAGAEVTQFHKTIHVPESVYREAETETLLNVVLYIVKIGGLVVLLALVIAGLVVATRANGLPWRRPLRWTLMLAVIPVASFAADAESLLLGYSTTIAWETFVVGLITEFVREIGLQLGLMFLALAGLEAAMPHALQAVTREGRVRFGRSAAVAALMVIAIITIAGVASQFVARAVPAAASVELVAPSVVATPLPALVEGAQSLFGAIIGAAAVALFTMTLPKKQLAIVSTVAIFCASVDPFVTAAHAPLMLAQALVIALLAWIIARHVLGANPLAWPLTIFTAATVSTAATLLQHNRIDLLANGVALVLLALAALAWACTGK